MWVMVDVTIIRAGAELYAGTSRLHEYLRGIMQTDLPRVYVTR
jgi:hypothetical protein